METKETVESDPETTAITEEFAWWSCIRELISATIAKQYTPNPTRNAHILMPCFSNKGLFVPSTLAATRVSRTGIRNPNMSTCGLKAKDFIRVFLSLQKKRTNITA